MTVCFFCDNRATRKIHAAMNRSATTRAMGPAPKPNFYVLHLGVGWTPGMLVPVCDDCFLAERLLCNIMEGSTVDHGYLGKGPDMIHHEMVYFDPELSV